MQICEYVKLVFISLFPCLKVYELVQNVLKEATFNRTACEDPNSLKRRAHYEENSRKAEDLQWCEAHVATPERNHLGTRQEKARKNQKSLPKERQALEVVQLMRSNKLSQQLRNEMRAGLNMNISSSTGCRSLIAADLHGRVAAKKPLMRPQNKVKKIEICKATP